MLTAGFTDNMDPIEILAREMALADINKRRAAVLTHDGFRPRPLPAVPDFYWRDFGAEWMTKATDFSDYSI